MSNFQNQRDRQFLTIPESQLTDRGNVLTLQVCPFRVGHNQRQRFLWRGDVTQPVTALDIDQTLSSRYQIPTAKDLLVQTPFRLKILHFNDLHGRISHLTSTGNVPIFSRWASRYHHQLDKYREDPQAGVLLLSAGDDMVGTPFDILMAEENHPYDLYQSLGVDVATLGNHDLDFGTQALQQMIQRAHQFPVLSANLMVPPALTGAIYPAALIEVKGVRVGIIGLTTTGQRKNATAKLLQFADPVAVVQNLLPVLRPYCHVLLVLSHLGYDLHAASATVEGYGDRQLAEALPYGAVDAIIGGHTHTILNEAGLSPEHIVNGIPILQAGAMGRFLGELTITLHDQHNVAVTSAKLTATADLPVHQNFETQQVAPILQALDQKLTQPLGQVEAHPDFDADVVLNDFATRELAIANFVTAGMLAQINQQGFAADIALTDAAILRAGLPTETLTYADWFHLMPHADTLCLWQLTGVQLQQFLLDNARRANRPCEPHLERGFVQFSSQVRYQINQGKQRQDTQIIEVLVGDRPLTEQLNQVFTLVSHSFLRQPAKHWEKTAQKQGLTLMSLANLPTKDTGLLLREELIAYTQAQGGVGKSGGANIDGRLMMARN